MAENRHLTTGIMDYPPHSRLQKESVVIPSQNTHLQKGFSQSHNDYLQKENIHLPADAFTREAQRAVNAEKSATCKRRSAVRSLMRLDLSLEAYAHVLSYVNRGQIPICTAAHLRKVLMANGLAPEKLSKEYIAAHVQGLPLFQPLFSSLGSSNNSTTKLQTTAIAMKHSELVEDLTALDWLDGHPFVDSTAECLLGTADAPEKGCTTMSATDQLQTDRSIACYPSMVTDMVKSSAEALPILELSRFRTEHSFPASYSIHRHKQAENILNADLISANDEERALASGVDIDPLSSGPVQSAAPLGTELLSNTNGGHLLNGNDEDILINSDHETAQPASDIEINTLSFGAAQSAAPLFTDLLSRVNGRQSLLNRMGSTPLYSQASVPLCAELLSSTNGPDNINRNDEETIFCNRSVQDVAQQSFSTRNLEDQQKQSSTSAQPTQESWAPVSVILPEMARNYDAASAGFLDVLTDGRASSGQLLQHSCNEESLNLLERWNKRRQHLLERGWKRKMQQVEKTEKKRLLPHLQQNESGDRSSGHVRRAAEDHAANSAGYMIPGAAQAAIAGQCKALREETSKLLTEFVPSVGTINGETGELIRAAGCMGFN